MFLSIALFFDIFCVFDILYQIVDEISYLANCFLRIFTGRADCQMSGRMVHYLLMKLSGLTDCHKLTNVLKNRTLISENILCLTSSTV